MKFLRRHWRDTYLDTAVIGGVGVANIARGKLAEASLPPDVLRAYHDQYPDLHAGFAASVQRLAHHPARLRGLVNGVKGKLFEERYLDWLNHGHLPAGYHAELASAANQPAWDIVVRDSYGHIDRLLQLKATQNWAEVRQAIQAHPEIDVVLPRDTFLHAGQHGAWAGHLIQAHQSLACLDHDTHAAVAHAEQASGAVFHWPEMAIVLALWDSFSGFRRGRLSGAEAARSGLQRSALAVAARGASWLAFAAGAAANVAIPVGMGARIVGGQVLHNLRRRRQLTAPLPPLPPASAERSSCA